MAHEGVPLVVIQRQLADDLSHSWSPTDALVNRAVGSADGRDRPAAAPQRGDEEGSCRLSSDAPLCSRSARGDAAVVLVDADLLGNADLGAPSRIHLVSVRA